MTTQTKPSKSVVSTAITTATFSKSLTSIVKSAKSQRERIQAIIDFSVQHYADNAGGVSYLNRTMEAVEGTTISSKQVKKYICARTNLKYGQVGKKGEERQSFSVQDKKASRITALEHDGDWFDYDKPAKEAGSHDTYKQVGNLIKTIKKNIDSDEGVNDLDQANGIMMRLVGILADLDAMSPELKIAV